MHWFFTGLLIVAIAATAVYSGWLLHRMMPTATTGAATATVGPPP